MSLDKVDRRNAAVFVSAPMSKPLHLRGIPHATMTVTVTGSGSAKGNIAGQLVVYLYDVDPKGLGTLLSFGPISSTRSLSG